MRAFVSLATFLSVTRLAFSQSTATSTGAATQTISVFLIDTDPQPLVASIVAADVSITSMHITCPTGTNSADCGYAMGINVVNQNGNTWRATINDGSDFTASWSCSLASSSAVCVESYGGSSANNLGVATSTYTGTDVNKILVTVTAGANKLAAASTLGFSSSSNTMSTTATVSLSRTASATMTSMSMVPSAAADRSWAAGKVVFSLGAVGAIFHLL